MRAALGVPNAAIGQTAGRRMESDPEHWLLKDFGSSARVASFAHL
jgi:hypothetical protein